MSWPFVAQPGADEARRLLVEELWNPTYLLSWWTILRTWLSDRLLVEVGDTDLTPLFAVLAVVAAIVLAVVVRRAVSTRRPKPDDSTGAVFDDEVLDVEDHRRRAAAHREAGRHDDAVIESYRAITAEALRRDLVRDLPDLTAHEVGATLASRYRDHTDRVIRAGHLFDRVRYGGGHAGPSQSRELADLDDALASAEPAADSAPGPFPAVPR